MSERRDIAMDAFKGVAILAVGLIHAVEIFQRGDPNWPAGRYVDHLARFAVPFFMAVLGMLTVRRYLGRVDWLVFWRRRLRSLVLPFLLWGGIYELAGLAVPEAPFGPLGRMLTGYSAGHLYFVPGYLSLLLILPLLRVVLRGDRTRASALALMAVAAHIVLLRHIELSGLDREPTDPLVRLYLFTEARLPLHWFGCFFAGALLALQEERLSALLRRHGRLLTWGLPLWLTLHALVGQHATEGVAWDWFWVTPYFLFGAMSAWIICVAAWPLVRGRALAGPLQWLGRNSYAVYLSHVLCLWWIQGALGDAAERPGLVAFAWVAALAGGVVYAPLHARLFEGRGIR
mgnify:CR=1 FL=1